VIDRVPVALFPDESWVEQLTVVMPTGNVDPDAGTQATSVEPLTKSSAEGLNVTGAPPRPAATTLMSAGIVSTGGVVSTTETVAEVRPARSR
jgi:hypothetical protein